MTKHFTKPTGVSPSQRFPDATAKVARDVTLADIYVVLCDWHGRVVWRSGLGDRMQVGDEIWKNAATRSRESLKTAVASVATLRENRILEAENDRGELFRVSMWPLNDPDIAVCMLAMRIPNELGLLTDRERACLRCLAQGMSTKDISNELNIGLTTVHTHLRRIREKMGLATNEALIVFAARYFFVPRAEADARTATTRKRSG